MTEVDRVTLKWRIVLLSVALGLITGMVDVFLDAHIFSLGSILEQIFEPSAFEIYIRGLILLIFLVFGCLMARTVGRLEQSEHQKDEAIRKLERTIEEIRTLRGIIPICAGCKKIRDDEGAWHQVEVYVRAHSEAEFSHGMCPDCLQAAHEELRGH